MLPLRILGFLWLMFSPCGTESTCPSDLNPLILEPAEVVEQYGYSLSVNCSSTAEEHEGIYWRVGDEDLSAEEDWNFISLNLSLSDYNMTAQCRIKLNESHECSKDIEVTVFKNPEVVSSIKHVSATGEETQYDLQCDVFNVAPVQNLIVTLYKDNETILTKPFNSTTKTPVNETVTLPVNISRSEGVVQLRCEAQLNFGPRGVQLPVVFQTHNISALYAPEMKTTNRIDLTVEDETVTLNCDTEGNPPPVFSWTCDGLDMLERTNNLTFAPGSLDRNCTCMAANNLGNRTQQYHIKVRRADPPVITTPEPQMPRACPLTLTPPEIVTRFGDPVLADCNTTATNAIGMGWEASVGGTGFEKPPHVPWRLEKLEDWCIQPNCYITLDDDYQCNVTLPITLYKTPDRVSVSGPEYGLEGDEYQLKCNIDNVAPANKLKVSWYKDDQEHNTTDFLETSVKPVNVSSTLIITAKRDYNGSIFRCEAVLHLGPNGPERVPTVSANYTAVVQYKPHFKSCPSHHNVVEHKFSLDKFSCQFGGNPPPEVQWYYEGEVFNSSKPLGRNDTGNYMMQIVNKRGSSNTSVDITVEYGPFINCHEPFVVEMSTPSKTPCKTSGLPAPTITWFKDGKQMVQWTKNGSGEYVLVAANTHGGARRTLHLDILYAPEMKEANMTMKVFRGQNVTVECKAEGNPPPEVLWLFNSSVTRNEDAVWQQKTLTVTVATSTVAGVYSCIARNRVGKVTRTVTLVIQDESSGSPVAFIWVFLILLLLLVFLVLLVFLHKRKKKHGQYSFLPIRTASDIPLSPRSTGGSL